jgi:short-subunit dehydrogenase
MGASVFMTNSASVPEKLTVIVTGASAGIGRLICQRLAQRKHRLVLAARSADKLAQLRTELEATGCECISVTTDVADPNGLEALVKATVDRFGRIDVLVNNAGIECFSEFDQLSLDQILQTIETNLTGAIVLTRQVVPIMRQQGFGRIINMASAAGKHGPPFGAVYGATKAGMIAFTQGLRGELLPVGISATAICPGFATGGAVYDDIIGATGKGTPTLMGGTTAEKVAAAVEKAIQTGQPEMILNFPALRPVFLFRDVFPRLGEKLILAFTFKFFRRAAKSKK